MNYYSRNLGDYAKDAGHLSALGHGIYTLLLDWYYGAERPIPHEDAHDIARCTPEEVGPILRKFFQRDGDVWRHKRCDAEIAAYRAKSEKAKTAGASGGLAKAKRTLSDSQANAKRMLDECHAVANQMLSDRLANQEPITKNQEEKPPLTPKGEPPVGEKPEKSITLKTYLDDCEKGGKAPIPEDDAVWRHADATGLPDEFLHLAWAMFERRYLQNGKRQKGERGWRQTFRNAVQENWFKLWYMNGSGWELTTAGRQTKMAAEHG